MSNSVGGEKSFWLKLNDALTTVIYAIILLCIFAYVAFRLYEFFVPTPNTILYLKKDWCGVEKIVNQESNNCFIVGDVSRALTGNTYILTTEDGAKIYINESIVLSKSTTSKK